MEIEAETGLIVVNSEQCIPEGLTAGSCHEVIELSSPINALNEISHSLCTLQPQQIEQLPLHYSHIQVGFEHGGGRGTTTGISPLYPSPTLHFGSTTEAVSYLDQYLEVPSPSSNLSFTHQSSSPPPLSAPPPPPPPMPKERRRRVPLDPNDIPTFPINQFEYYKEIEQLLATETYPNNASENYKIQLRKRSFNYLLIDNTLYHNPKKPRKVVMKKENQRELVEAAHISDCDGVHLGIKKMLSLLEERFFWRCLYEDVATYVNSCPKCRDHIDVALRASTRSRSGMADLREEEEAVDDLAVTSVLSTSVQTVPIIWKEVEIQIHGPFNTTSQRNEFIVTITDPESCFVHASPFPRAGYSSKLTEFIVKTFYTFGFPEPYMVGEKDLFEIVSGEYDWRLKQEAGRRGLSRRETAHCPWVGQLLELLVQRRPQRWDRELDKFMYQFRTGAMRQHTPYKCSPFYAMFQRTSNLHEKENMYGRPRNRRRTQSTILQCDTCDEVFTSKISFRIHIKRHSMEVPKDEPLKDVNTVNKRLKPRSGKKVKQTSESVEKAMSELKNYLSKTKDARRKRGKYQKFPVELQEHMILYFLNHGRQKAASYFSQLLGTNVSGSTIRNLVKSQEDFQPIVKEEIARYAVEHGIDKASKYFTEVLKKDVSTALVRRFKRVHGRKFIKLNQKFKEEMRAKKANVRKMAKLTTEDKYNIGSYSCEHSVNQTIKYFHEHLGIELLDTDIENFQKSYIEKKAQESVNIEVVNEEVEIEKTEENQTYGTAITYQEVSVNDDETVCFSSSDHVVTIHPAYYQENICYQTSCYSSESKTQPENLIVTPHIISVSQDETPTIEATVHSGSQESQKASSSEDWTRFHIEHQIYQIEVPRKDCAEKTDELLSEEREMLNSNVKTVLESKDMPPPEPYVKDMSPPEPYVKAPALSSTASTSTPQKKKKRKISGKKRGSYAAYSPELRAEIGKYAAEHSGYKASKHFSKILGHDLPESTVRGLKERYLAKVRHCDVTSLGYSPRGRPLRLGKYDEVVQECLKELLQSGEKASSFLAIMTAKQILTKLEPGLLKENGGTVVLNATWAKSFLKRIGIRNNS